MSATEFHSPMSVLQQHTKYLLCAVFGLGLAFSQTSSALAEVKLPLIIGDHMLVQRDRPIHVWGWAEPGEDVAVTLSDAQRETHADADGVWAVDLPPMNAGGPFQMTVKGNNVIKVDDIMVGDLWVAAGQSNMEMPLSGFTGATVKDSEHEIQTANHPEIRLFLVNGISSSYPRVDFHQKSGWMVCTPETVANFSAVAYFFGREISSTEKVPVGLIDSTWGGTPAESWISLKGLTADASLAPAFAEFNRIAAGRGEELQRWAREDADDAQTKSLGQTPPQRKRSGAYDGATPAGLFNGMIAPLLPMRVSGVIWYQGESNASLLRSPIYGRLFPALIQDWRRAWKQEDLPFLFVQLANYKTDGTSYWPAVREAQRRSLYLAHTGMAVTIDVGNSNNVHPSDKQTVGHRLALIARSTVYSETVEFSGPFYSEVSLEPDGLRVWFRHAQGMHSSSTVVPGFEIAGEDHAFLPATEARIEGDSIVVSNPTIQKPVYVRYGYQDDPKLDLYNDAQLPASPFSSEP